MTGIQHITLDTGHVSRCPCEEPDDTHRVSLEAALERPGERMPVPGHAGHSYGVTPYRDALIGTVWGTVERDAVPVVTFGVAPTAFGAHSLWRNLHERRGGLETVPYVTDIDRPPAPPWLAARMEIGATMMTPADLLWLASFERALATAWISRR